MAVGDAVAGGGAIREYPIECFHDRHCFSKTLYKERNHVERFFNRISYLLTSILCPSDSVRSWRPRAGLKRS